MYVHPMLNQYDGNILLNLIPKFLSHVDLRLERTRVGNVHVGRIVFSGGGGDSANKMWDE